VVWCVVVRIRLVNVKISTRISGIETVMIVGIWGRDFGQGLL